MFRRGSDPEPRGARDGGTFIWKKSNPLAVVIDNSAAMQALTPAVRAASISRGKNRRCVSGKRGDISFTSPAQPRRIAPAFSTLTEARLALSQTQAERTRPTIKPRWMNFLGNLASEARVAKVIRGSPTRSRRRCRRGYIRLAVGSQLQNFAIGSFSLQARSPWRGGLHTSLTVGNFSTADVSWS